MTIQNYPDDKIHDNPYQGRPVKPADVQDLAENIDEHGLQDIPTARPHPDKPGHVQLIKGHRRRVAWFVKHKDPMPIDVQEGVTDRQMFERNVIENFQREDPNAIQKATQMQAYINAFGATQAQAGKLFGIERQGSVSNVLRLLKLPAPVQSMVASGDLAEREARLFVSAAAVVPAKELSKIAKQYSQADDAEDKQFIIDQDLEDAVFQHGRALDNADWDLQWPKTPIPVDPRNVGKDGFPAEIVACKGCPFNTRLGNSAVCVQPGCYDLKQGIWTNEALKRASKKLAIPIADLEQATDSTLFHILFDGTNYGQSMNARRLVQAGTPTELGLWLLESRSNGSNHYGNDVFGYRSIALGTTNPDACKRYLKRFEEGGDGAKKPGKELSPEAFKRQEEVERAARRVERSMAFKAKYDVSWLITNAARLIGERISIGGGVLFMLSEEISYFIHDFELLERFEGEEEKQLKQAKSTMERENRLRALVAFRLLCSLVCHHDGKGKPDYDLEFTEKKIADLAGDGKEWAHHGGFGVKLPGGWNKLPIHKTEFNCWYCGVFASSETLTKRDLAEGWAKKVEAKKVVDVRCPNCADDTKPSPKASTKKAAKPKGKAKKK